MDVNERAWQDPNGNHNVLVLNYNDSKRKLNYNWFDNRWNRNYRFVARRPRNSLLLSSVSFAVRRSFVFGVDPSSRPASYLPH